MQTNDQIWFEKVEPMLQAKANLITKTIASLKKKLKKAPAGRLRISKSRNQMQWYHVKGIEGENGSYIPVKKIALASALAQKDYNGKALAKLQQQLSIIQEFLARYDSECLNALYESLQAARQELVEPIFDSNVSFAKRWLSMDYERKQLAEDIPEIRTLLGERVRSKSEAIIADTLFRLGVPYKYECAMEVCEKQGKKQRKIKLFPDFTCLNVRLRKQYIWEHFGMMGDSEYGAQVVWKINCFESNGIFFGENLIVSLESAEIPLDATRVERLARHFLL